MYRKIDKIFTFTEIALVFTKFETLKKNIERVLNRQRLYQKTTMALSPRTASPGTPGALGNAYAVDNKAFGEILAGIITSAGEAFDFALLVGSLQKGQRLHLPDGRLVGRRELRSAVSAVSQAIKELKKYHKEALKAKKRQAIDPITGLPVKRGGGFSLPIRVTDELRGFFATAQLGLRDPRDGNSGTLVEFLGLLTQQGVTSPSLLTPLFSIYALVNGLQDPAQRNILHADTHMQQYLGNTLVLLQNEIKPHMSKPSKTGKPQKMLPGFNPQGFPYAYLQNIIQKNKIPQTKEMQAALAADATVMGRLQQEQQMVSGTLAIYREANKPAEQERRKLKRRADAALKAAAGR